MKIRTAVITAANPAQRTLPLHTLIDRDGEERPVLHILVDEVLAAGIENVCMVVCPGDQAAYTKAAGDHASALRFVEQTEPRGYADAIRTARNCAGDQPFLHLIGDHVYVDPQPGGTARKLLEIAEAESCAVSAVQSTRESLLPLYGAVGGQRVHGRPGLYRVDTVIEKPTPTQAEQSLIVPGMRAGHYLCFFGMHVLTPPLMEILGRQLAEASGHVTLSSALAELAQREQYLAYLAEARRYDLGVRYGLLSAQVALALSGRDRAEVLAQLLELLAARAAAAPAN